MMTQMGGITILLTNHLNHALLTLTNPFVGCHKYDLQQVFIAIPLPQVWFPSLALMKTQEQGSSSTLI
jgi:hypothetical protein